MGSLLTISEAVLAHKWAEGLVLGISLKRSNISIKRASFMILL